MEKLGPSFISCSIWHTRDTATLLVTGSQRPQASELFVCEPHFPSTDYRLNPPSLFLIASVLALFVVQASQSVFYLQHKHLLPCQI
jgi:hypothetical protein